MIIVEGRRYIETDFASEAELEQVVVDNAEYIFGPETIYLPKALIRSPDGAGTIPDGFVVDLAERRWFLVEAELAHHGVWTHIAPQVAKQLIAARQPEARRTLVEAVVSQVKSHAPLQERFAELGIPDIDIRRVVTEIFETPPIVGLPIDRVPRDLREWAETVRAEVRLWTIRKLTDFDDPAKVMYEFPDEYQPTLDTSAAGPDRPTGRATYDVTVADLVDAGLLAPGMELTMPYKPRDGATRTYIAQVTDDGSLSVEGRTFSAPSYAALHGIQLAGSDRRTVNGWKAWRTPEGESLAAVRDRFLATRPSDAFPGAEDGGSTRA